MAGGPTNSSEYQEAELPALSPEKYDILFNKVSGGKQLSIFTDKEKLVAWIWIQPTSPFFELGYAELEDAVKQTGILLWASTSVGRPSSCTTCAMVIVLPEPVMPSSTWCGAPARTPSTRAVMARGWSPEGAKGALSWKGIGPAYPAAPRGAHPPGTE